MPTLNIAGKKVTVGDDFLKLSQADQQKTVNEIASHIGIAPQAKADKGPTPADLGWKPGQPITPEIKAAFLAHAQDPVTDAEKASMTPPPDTSFPAQVSAGITAAANSVPVAGPTLLNWMEGGRAAIQHMTPEQVTAEREKLQRDNPTATTIGQVAGTVLPFLAGAEIPVASTILGLDAGAPMAANMILGGASQKLISMADEKVRGQDPNQKVLGDMTGSDVAALGGIAGPVVGKVIGAGAKLVNDQVVQPVTRVVRGMMDPKGAADATLTRAFVNDVGQTMTPTEEAAAAANGQPIINADRGGGNVRTLARTASNMDPGSDLPAVVHDRFVTQNQRAKDWIQRNTGAPTDIHAAQQGLDAAKVAANDPAYRAAYTHPDAQAIFTPEIEQLMGSTDFQRAIKGAVKTSTNDAVLRGQTPIKNPFVVDAKTGDYRLRMLSDDTKRAVDQAKSALDDARASGDANKIAAAQDQLNSVRQIHTDTLANDDVVAQPSLEFWDHVQRNLRQNASAKARIGKNFDASQLNGMRRQLNGVLDSTVPDFQVARHGAAAAFGAEDALEAGQKFAAAKISDMPGAADAINKMSPAEKKLFASGFGASLIDKVAKAPESTNVINQVFSSPTAKEQIRLAMGQKATDELEPFLRVENIMQKTKQMVGSGGPPAAQLFAHGVIGYGGTAALGGGIDPRHWNPMNWGTAIGLTAAARIGAKYLGKTVDQKVMGEVARMLSSNDPALIQQAVKNASKSSKSADAIKAIDHGLQIAIRSGTTAAAAPALQQGTNP